MPEPDETDVPDGTFWTKQRMLMTASAIPLVALLLLAYRACTDPGPREFGTIGGGGEIVEQDSDEESPEPTQTKESRPELGFSLSGGSFRTNFTKGRGDPDCNFPEEFTVIYRLIIQVGRTSLFQVGTNQELHGKLDRSDGSFRAIGRTPTHTEIIRAIWQSENMWEGDYFFENDCGPFRYDVDGRRIRADGDSDDSNDSDEV